MNELQEIIDAKYRFISETGEKPSRIHMTKSRFDRLKNEVFSINGNCYVDDGELNNTSIDGLEIVISENIGDTFHLVAE